MKKRLIAATLAGALLMQIFATPVIAIEQIVEDNKSDSQVEEIKKEEPKAASKSPGIVKSPGDVVTDENLRNAVLNELLNNGTITYEERDNHVITVSDMKTLTQLGAYYVEDCTGLEYATNLTALEIDTYAMYSFDFSILAGMSKLENFSVGTYIEEIENVNVLNTLPSLKICEIDFYSNEGILDSFTELNKLNRKTDLVLIIKNNYFDYNIEKNTIITGLGNLNVKTVIYDEMLLDLNYETMITKGSSPTINFTDMSPVFSNYILNPDSVFYRPNVTLSTSTEGVTVDNVNKTITVTPDDSYPIGTKYVYFDISYDYWEGVEAPGTYNYFCWTYTLVYEGNSTKEIAIPDNQFRQIMLEDHDIDHDEKITMLDINNTEDLYLWNVTDFTKLDLFKNLTWLTLTSNSESFGFNFNKLASMNKLATLNVSNVGTITNVSALNGLDSLECIDISLADASQASKLKTLENDPNLTLYVRLEDDTDADAIYTVAAALEQCPVEDLIFDDLYMDLEIGEPIIVGAEPITISYTLHDIFRDFTLNSSSRFYIEDFEPYSNTEDIVFDNVNQTIIIKADENSYIGGNTATVYISGTSISFTIAYTVLGAGDYDTVLDISDDLRGWLFDNGYDVNNDGEFSPAEMEQVTYMSLYDCHDYKGLEYATNLETLYLSIGNENLNFDCSVLENMENLQRVELSNVVTITKCNTLNGLINLQYFDLGFGTTDTLISNSAQIIKINNPTLKLFIETYSSETDEKINNAANSIKSTKVNNIMYSNLYRQTYLEEQVPLGGSKEFTFDQINPFLNRYILNSSSVFYNANPQFTASNPSKLSIDMVNKKITINATDETEPGNRYEWFRYSYTKGIYDYTSQMAISYYVSVDGDHDTDLSSEITDPELRRLLLNNYDKDGNEKITEYDMINIDNLYMNSVRDLKGLEYATNLRSITVNCVDGTVSNLNAISGLNKLEEINLYNLNAVDFSIFSSMTALKDLEVREIYSVSNVSSLNAINTLERLDLTFINQSEISKLSALNNKANFGIVIGLEQENYENPITNEQIEEAVEYIEALKVTKVVFRNIIQSIDLGQIEIGKTVTVEFDEISPWISYMENTPGSKLHQDSIRFAMDLYDGRDITLDNDARKITIVTDENYTGEQEIRLETVYRFNDSISYVNSFHISYRVMASGDPNKEINVPDDNLRQLLIEQYNFDGKDMISEFDMYNIESMNINCLVEDLTGLESAVNLKSLYINAGNLKSFAPISNLDKLNALGIVNQETEGVDYSDIQNIPNLLWLSISVETPFDLNDIGYMQYLGSLSVYATELYNIDALNVLPQLHNICLEADEIDGFGGLRDLDLIANNDTSLELRISNYSYNIEPPYTDEQYEEFLNALTNVGANIDSVVAIFNRIFVDLGEIEATEDPIYISYKDLNPILDAFVGAGPLHKDDIMLETSDYIYWENNNSDLRVDAENKRIEINPTTAGDNLMCLQLGRDDYWNYNGNGVEVSGPIVITFNVKFAGDTHRLIDIPDDNFRAYLERECNFDGEEGISEYDMLNISELDIYGVRDLTGIEEAKNLKELFVEAYEDSDFTKLQGLDRLESIELGLCDDGANLLPIARIPNLKILRIYDHGIRGEDFNINNLIKIMPNLEILTVNIPVTSLTNLSKMTSLKELQTSIPTDGKLSPIYNRTSLENITIREIDRKLDYTKFNSMPNLERLQLEFIDVESIKGSNGGLDVIDYTKYNTEIRYDDKNGCISAEDEQTLLNEINKTKGKYNFYFSLSLNRDLGGIPKGTQKNYATYADFDAVVNSTLDTNSRFFNANINVYEPGILQIDTTNHTASVTAGDEVKTQETRIYLNGNSAYCNICFKFKATTDEGSTTALEFNDKKLQQILEERYNVDGVPGFSENDLLNLTELEIDNEDITDLSGLEGAVNLAELYAANNRIRSIAPLVNLRNLEFADLANNEITDITCAKDHVFNEFLFMNLYGNFIDFTNGSANLSVLEKELIRTSSTNGSAIVASQKYGSPDDFDEEVTFGDANVEARLIAMGVETNEHGKMTRRTLYDATVDKEDGTMINRLDFDNMGIRSLSGFEYLGELQELILTNNSITDITPLRYLANLKELNLSHNHITDISPLSKYIGSSSMGDRTLNYNFAFNNISDISPIGDWDIITRSDVSYYYGPGMVYRNVSIDLAENNISSIAGVENWKNIQWLDLASNNISDISNLANFNFTVWPNGTMFMGDEYWLEQLDRFQGIRLTSNNIDLNAEGTNNAKTAFDNKHVRLELDEGDEPPLPPFIVGDVDENGVVNSTDCTIILRYLKGYETLNDIQLLAADADKNGVVNSTDCTKILRYLKGYETLD